MFTLVVVFIFIGNEDTPVVDKGAVPDINKGENAVVSTSTDDCTPVINKTDVFAITSSYGT